MVRRFLIISGLLIAGCGAKQEPAAPAPVVVAPRPAAPVEEPNAAVMHLIWHVYWKEIHCLTIFPTPGLIRSEDRTLAVAPYETRSSHFSAVSFYVEEEARFSPAFQQATSLQDLLRRLDDLEEVEIVEDVNEAQEF